MPRVSPFLVFAVSIGMIFPAMAQKGSAASESDLAATSARGHLLYEYDQAAWHGSDAAQATHPREQDLGTYIAQKTDTGWTVAFGRLNEAKDAFLIACEAIQGKSPEVFTGEKFDTPRPDRGFFLAAARAIETAKPDFQPADKQRYNIAVLPAPAGQLYVYFIPAQTQEGIFPLGADVRFLVSPDGARILEKRQMHKGIIPTGGAVPKGSKLAGGTHSHVLSDVPEDSDVFYVLTRRPPIPEYVGTEAALYEIATDGTIRIVKKNAKAE